MRERGEPDYDEVRPVSGTQESQECRDTEAGIGSYRSDPMSRRQHQRGLRQKFHHPICGHDMTGLQRSPQQPLTLDQPGDHWMMGWLVVFDRMDYVHLGYQPVRHTDRRRSSQSQGYDSVVSATGRRVPFT